MDTCLIWLPCTSSTSLHAFKAFPNVTSRMGTMVTSPCNRRAWNSKNSSFGSEQHCSGETTSLFRRAWKYCITFWGAIFAVSQIRRNCLPNSGCPQSHWSDWSDWRLALAGSSIVLIPASIMDAAATELAIPQGTFSCCPSASKIIGLIGCLKPPQKHQSFWVIPGRIKKISNSETTFDNELVDLRIFSEVFENTLQSLGPSLHG